MSEAELPGHEAAEVLCFVLKTLPNPSFVRMDDVLEVIASGDDADNTIRLEELGLRGVGGRGTRLLRFRQAPDGPRLLFQAELTTQALSPDSLLPLPRTLFRETPCSNLVVVADQVAGLMLSVSHCLAFRPVKEAL